MTENSFILFFLTKFLPLMYAAIGFGLLIAIHECGHFLFCKLFGIKTPTFSIGFGPELFRRNIGDTNFRLALIPFGGYVEIAGLAEVGQGDQEHAQLTGNNSFSSKPYWQQLLVMLGGILFNLLFAYGVFCSLFLIGTSDKQGIVVTGIVKNSAAMTYDLKAGDIITEVNHISLRDRNHKLVQNAHEILLSEIRSNPHKNISITVERNNAQHILTIQLDERKEGENLIGSLGAELRSPITRLPFFQALNAGIKETNRWIVAIVFSIKKLISQRSLEGAGGPVMIMSMSFDAAKNGFLALFTFLALISINLALINILPLGALDGGQIFFVTLEAIMGRSLPLNLRHWINLASWIFFISIALFLTYKDIALLFGDKIIRLYQTIISVMGL